MIRAVFLTDINGTCVPRGDSRWLMAIQYVPERGERPEDFTDERCRELIRRGAGRPDVTARMAWRGADDTRQTQSALSETLGRLTFR